MLKYKNIYSRNIFKYIEDNKVVKYFMNKKKSDTGTFLCVLINIFGEYKNLENICKHGVKRIKSMARDPLNDMIIKFIGKLVIIIKNIDNNKLPDGKRISLISSLRNRRLKKILKEFLFEHMYSNLAFELYYQYLPEFCTKSAIYTASEIIEKCLKEDFKKYSAKVSGRDPQFIDVASELKNVCSPLDTLGKHFGHALGAATLNDFLGATDVVQEEYFKIVQPNLDPQFKKDMHKATLKHAALVLGTSLAVHERKVYITAARAVFQIFIDFVSHLKKDIFSNVRELCDHSNKTSTFTSRLFLHTAAQRIFEMHTDTIKNLGEYLDLSKLGRASFFSGKFKSIIDESNLKAELTKILNAFYDKRVYPFLDSVYSLFK